VSVSTTVLIALGLAMDAFAVSIASGLSIPRLTPRHVFRMAFHFGLFQALMPVLGWLAGRTVASLIGAWDHWIALALLAFIGGRMLWEARTDDARKEGADPTRGWTLVTLSVATSIDALAVGLSMAMLGVSVWVPALVIGVVAAAMSTIGIAFGSRLGRRWGRWSQVVGGLVLIGIGVRIVIEHLSA
jgi:putative Mn2+ efflux pump MntP